MAILKHIASKNADYGETERYLIFQHDEYTLSFIKINLLMRLSRITTSSALILKIRKNMV